jgi:hypothetical protein
VLGFGRIIELEELELGHSVHERGVKGSAVIRKCEECDVETARIWFWGGDVPVSGRGSVRSGMEEQACESAHCPGMNAGAAARSEHGTRCGLWSIPNVMLSGQGAGADAGGEAGRRRSRLEEG